MKRLQQEREARGWSRAELARRAHLNPGTVGLIEVGRFVPYPGQVAKLARALGLSKRELLGDAKQDDVDGTAAERAERQSGGVADGDR
jgi:ribosome-binding protein aMBF1 (putative translation factor)